MAASFKMAWEFSAELLPQDHLKEQCKGMGWMRAVWVTLAGSCSFLSPATTVAPSLVLPTYRIMVHLNGDILQDRLFLVLFLCINLFSPGSLSSLQLTWALRWWNLGASGLSTLVCCVVLVLPLGLKLPRPSSALCKMKITRCASYTLLCQVTWNHRTCAWGSHFSSATGGLWADVFYLLKLSISLYLLLYGTW